MYSNKIIKKIVFSLLPILLLTGCGDKEEKIEVQIMVRYSPREKEMRNKVRTG